jgi:hypothetical protein
MPIPYSRSCCSKLNKCRSPIQMSSVPADGCCPELVDTQAKEFFLRWHRVRCPEGPWPAIAAFIGTKSTRQTTTHGQKLRQKLRRWNGRLRQHPTASKLLDTEPMVSDSISLDRGGLTPAHEPATKTMATTSAPATVHAFPCTSCRANVHQLSAGAEAMIELILSEVSDEVLVTRFSDEPEILPQGLLDDLLELLSGGDLESASPSAPCKCMSST